MLSNLHAARNLTNEHYLGDFAQVLTHRIRNLLAGIEGYTDLLTDTLGSREQRELALRILESTARIEFFLNDLQYYSRPFHMVKMPVGLEDLLNRLVTALAEDNLRHLQLDVAPEACVLMVDPGLIQQALLTIIQNAFDALPKDTHVTVHVVADRDQRTVAFHVRNEGTITLDHAAHKVFEPFFTTKPHNLGIGLPLARRIAEAHGGSLYLSTNNPREGTCFTLELPMPSEEEIFSTFDS